MNTLRFSENRVIERNGSFLPGALMVGAYALYKIFGGRIIASSEIVDYFRVERFQKLSFCNSNIDIFGKNLNDLELSL